MKEYETGHDQKTFLLNQLRSDKEEANQRIVDLEERIKSGRKKLKDAESACYQSDQEVDSRLKKNWQHCKKRD